MITGNEWAVDLYFGRRQLSWRLFASLPDPDAKGRDVLKKRLPLEFQLPAKAEDDDDMDEVELKSEKNGDELERGAGPALTKANEGIEIPAVLQPAAEADTKETLGVSKKRRG
jgi:hypothetical protein